MKRDPRLDASLNKLADKFESGHLLAATNPAGFIDVVAERIEKLEAKIKLVEDAVSEASLDLKMGYGNLAQKNIDKALKQLQER